jgi:lipopolysaccharide transport system permease protein
VPLIWIILGKLTWAVFLLPLILALEMLLFTGINWIWSALSVFIPDLRQVTPLITSILIFITPIFYPEEFIPAWANWVVKINPLAHLIRLFRTVLIEGAIPLAGGVVWFVVACIALCLIGYHWYMKIKQNFSDYL